MRNTATSTPAARTATTSTSRSAKTTTTAALGGMFSNHGHHSTGSSNARVPATYVIHPGSKVVPPVISVPAFLAIQLTVVSADGKAHRAQLRAPGAPLLKVPAGGSASVLLGGMRAGQFSLLVDGRQSGSLKTGGEPGP